jgi:hypothetical protein
MNDTLSITTGVLGVGQQRPALYSNSARGHHIENFFFVHIVVISSQHITKRCLKYFVRKKLEILKQWDFFQGDGLSFFQIAGFEVFLKMGTFF